MSENSRFLFRWTYGGFLVVIVIGAVCFALSAVTGDGRWIGWALALIPSWAFSVMVCFALLGLSDANRGGA